MKKRRTQAGGAFYISIISLLSFERLQEQVAKSR